jgi:hypothetical protein
MTWCACPEIRSYEPSGKSLDCKKRYRRKVSLSSSKVQIVTKLGHIPRVEFSGKSFE